MESNNNVDFKTYCKMKNGTAPRSNHLSFTNNQSLFGFQMPRNINGSAEFKLSCKV